MKPEPLCLDKVRTVRLADRNSKVRTEDFGTPWRPGASFHRFLASLPPILAARDFLDVADRIASARHSGRPVILAMGAHPIKVGLNPLITDLMQRGVLTGVALNGAGVIHDSEVAMAGATSEDVEAELGTGRFGMAQETAELINQAIRRGVEKGWGLGESVGRALEEGNFPYGDQSILASGARFGVPVTVHVAIGTDIVHMHPSFRGDLTGAASHLDFRIFARMISELEHGVYINLGSAVLLPEVFLKALSLVRNLGYEVRRFTSVNMDFIRHYRPLTNVVQRPTREGGTGYHFTGHHEIMFPLLAAAVLEALEQTESESSRSASGHGAASTRCNRTPE